MKIQSVKLERFRQFNNTEFRFTDFNLLVGPNNSGKTTILHAIRAFFRLMKGHVRFEGKPPKATYHKRFLSSTEEIAPTPNITELWNRQKAGQPIKITVVFEDGLSFTLQLRHQFGQIHVSTTELPKDKSSTEIASYIDQNVAFIPGLVGVLVAEPYSTNARRISLATEGRYSEIFRSSLQQLKTRDDSLIEKINSVLGDIFSIEVTDIAFDEDADEFVTVKYSQGRTKYDVVSSGSGLQQVIQMLTYLYLGQPSILLIDEPDAHLHSKLQASLGHLLRNVAKDLDA